VNSQRLSKQAGDYIFRGQNSLHRVSEITNGTRINLILTYNTEVHCEVVGIGDPHVNYDGKRPRLSYETVVSVYHSGNSEEEISYNEPTISIDMFRTPPPSFPGDDGKTPTYTIVPGQIEAAAEHFNITPNRVYGCTWIASSGFTKEEEVDIEESYYYEDIVASDVEEDESLKHEEDEMDSEELDVDLHKDNDDDDSRISWNNSERDDYADEDSIFDMEDYEDDLLSSSELEHMVGHYMSMLGPNWGDGFGNVVASLP
jgi:hypothetical protein